MGLLRIWALILLNLGASGAWAQDVAFSNLSDEQAQGIIEEFSGNFTHTSVSGASPLGSVFGFEVAVIAGMTTTDEIDKLAKQTDPGAEADKIPHGGILAMVSVPFGLTGEASFIPEVGGEDFKFSNMGLGLKWSPTSGFIELPFSLAIKGHYMKSSLTFKQTSGVTATVDFKDTVMGLMVLASKNLIFIEPYAGIGVIKGDGEFDVTGTSIFASGSQSYSDKTTGTQLLAGVEANLLFLKGGAEISNQFGVTRYSVKVGFTF